MFVRYPYETKVPQGLECYSGQRNDEVSQDRAFLHYTSQRFLSLKPKRLSASIQAENISQDPAGKKFFSKISYRKSIRNAKTPVGGYQSITVHNNF